MDHTPTPTDPHLFGLDVMHHLAVIANVATDLRALAHDRPNGLSPTTIQDLDSLAVTANLAVLQLVAPTPELDRTDDLQTTRRQISSSQGPPRA